jgi:hypothetical protein
MVLLCATTGPWPSVQKRAFDFAPVSVIRQQSRASPKQRSAQAGLHVLGAPPQTCSFDHAYARAQDLPTEAQPLMLRQSG